MSKIVLKLGNDVSTDIIYPGRYMATVHPNETPQYAFADFKEFNQKLNSNEIQKGSIIVAGKNFGCGSSREQAVSCLKGHNLVILAESFARIFLQNAINLGLKIIIVPDLEAVENDEIELKEDKVININTGKIFKIIPFSKTQQEMLDAGGLIQYTRKLLLKKTS